MQDVMGFSKAIVRWVRRETFCGWFTEWFAAVSLPFLSFGFSWLLHIRTRKQYGDVSFSKLRILSFSRLVSIIFVTDPPQTDQEEETKEIIEYGGEDNNNMVSARPRRMSEIPDPPQPILPIPEGSAFFILSQNNRCEIQSNTAFGLITRFQTNIHKVKQTNNRNSPPHNKHRQYLHRFTNCFTSFTAFPPVD